MHAVKMIQVDGRRDKLYKIQTRVSLPPARRMSIHSPTWQDLDDTPKYFSSKDRRKRRGQQKRTAGKGQLEQFSQKGHPEQNNQDRASRQDCQHSTVRSLLIEQDI
jgi:hypothetical protein